MSVGLGEYFEATPKGLIVKGKPSFEACEALWETFLTVERTIQMCVGDAMRYFRERWGERADQIISHRTGWSLSTIRAYEWTAEKVPQGIRRLDVLDYSHHQAVARLPPRDQKKWLDRAAEGDERQGVVEPWPVSRLKAAIKANGDQPVTTWVCVAFCDSEGQRDKLLSELESRGIRCKASEKR